jgi:hypothetical protein
VLITAHQAFLTQEALAARVTVANFVALGKSEPFLTDTTLTYPGRTKVR